MKRSERIKAISSIMELVSQYGYCNYLLGKNMRDDEKIQQLEHQQNDIYSIIRYELYAMIDRLEKEEREEINYVKF